MPRIPSEVRARRPVQPRRALPVRPRRPVQGSQQPARRPEAGAQRLAFTTRAALLGLAVCVVVLTLAYPARQYLSQRAKIASLQSQQADDARAVQQLRAIIANGSDATAIRDEARRRLQLMMPGDQVFYLPQPPAGSAVVTHSGGVQTPLVADGHQLPWYDEVWKSTVAAGH